MPLSFSKGPGKIREWVDPNDLGGNCITLRYLYPCTLCFGIFQELGTLRTISTAYCRCKLPSNKSDRLFYSVSTDSLWPAFHDSDQRHNGYSGRLYFKCLVRNIWRPDCYSSAFNSPRTLVKSDQTHLRKEGHRYYGLYVPRIYK